MDQLQFVSPTLSCSTAYISAQVFTLAVTGGIPWSTNDSKSTQISRILLGIIANLS